MAVLGLVCSHQLQSHAKTLFPVVEIDDKLLNCIIFVKSQEKLYGELSIDLVLLSHLGTLDEDKTTNGQWLKR